MGSGQVKWWMNGWMDVSLMYLQLFCVSFTVITSSVIVRKRGTRIDECVGGDLDGWVDGWMDGSLVYLLLFIVTF